VNEEKVVVFHRFWEQPVMVHKHLKYRQSQHASLKQKREEAIKSQRKTGRKKLPKTLKTEGEKNLPRQKSFYQDYLRKNQRMFRISILFKALKDNIVKFMSF